MKPRPRFTSYTAPKLDSPRAKAQAVQFLVGARSLDNVTAEAIAHRYRLSHATAVDLLLRAGERRS